MYSWEITETMRKHDFRIPSNLYDKIRRSSPQINHVKYDGFTQKFEMWDNEGNYWSFDVYPDNPKN